MITTTTQYRVTYADSDPMGIVYYGNYPKFYEIGRTEMIRELGYTYQEIEESGIYMPVASMNNKYIRPVYYDELITIETTLKKIPEVRMVFHNRILNEKGEEVNTAEVTLVFLNAETNRPTRAPEKLLELLKKHMKE